MSPVHDCVGALILLVGCQTGQHMKTYYSNPRKKLHKGSVDLPGKCLLKQHVCHCMPFVVGPPSKRWSYGGLQLVVYLLFVFYWTLFI